MPPTSTMTSQPPATAGIQLRRYGEGPPLLLLHGLGSSGADWAFQVPALAARHQLLVPDLPGCGASPACGPASIEGYAQRLWDRIDPLAPGPIAIAGFSLGGAVALEMTLQRPARVARLATINSLPSYRIDHWRKWLEFHLQVAMVRVLGLRRTAAMVARRMFPMPHQAAMRARVLHVVGGSRVEDYLRCAHALADWCAAERCAGFTTPMLMLAGEHDYTPLDEKRAWAGRLGAELRVVGGSRHGTPFDAIGATNRALGAFFGGEPVPQDLRLDRPEETPSAPPESPAAVYP